jgi:hypothetical protein
VKRLLCIVWIIVCKVFKRLVGENIPEQSYDRVAIAGGVYDVYDVIRQVDIADRLHQIKKLGLLIKKIVGRMGLKAIMSAMELTCVKRVRKSISYSPI